MTCMATRVVLAMSGGVDSSVAAYLLKQQGYEVVGLFMRTGVHGHEDHQPSPLTPPSPPGGEGRVRGKGCCSALDAGDARRVADRLDIPFYALDFEAEFNRIIDYFADEYIAGRTPNPCVVCNNWLKFGKLWSYGKQIQADFIATGHYAQIVRPAVPLTSGLVGEPEPELHRGTDPNKDQSYVLFGLRRTLLKHLLFPIGGYHKEAIRDIARKLDLCVADKPDSVEICFVPGGEHAAVVRARRPELQTVGNFVDQEGNVLGAHEGIEKYTIGQRKGLNYAAGSRRYVLEIVPSSNDIVLGDREELLATGLLASRVNWLIDVPTAPLSCQAKIRYRHQPAAAVVTPLPDGGAQVAFAEPQSAITPGQAVVFYAGERVLGGGWIELASKE